MSGDIAINDIHYTLDNAISNSSTLHYKLNDVKFAIMHNTPIEEKLHVIAVVSNPCLYARRYALMREFITRMEIEEPDVCLYVVEMAYGDQPFSITAASNPRHLQLRSTVPLWHKENMINLGVRNLLPTNYRAFAWIDADIEFESATWAMDTLKVLNGCKDVVQLFSHCVDMSRDEMSLNIFNSFGYSYNKHRPFIAKGVDQWHPGFAWAITRTAYEKMGGLYEDAVLGSGDTIMAMSFIGRTVHMHNKQYHADYNDGMMQFQMQARYLRLGYVPGVVRHHYHGTKQNRKYVERWKILMKHQYSPRRDIMHDALGVLIPTAYFSEAFRRDIMQYFIDRKEDD